MNDYKMLNNILSNFLNPNDWYPGNSDTNNQNNNLSVENNQQFQLPNQSQTPSHGRLATPEGGYMIGNLFMDSYIPYKNYEPQRLIPQNDQGKQFLRLSEMSFAAHELNLYLDLHPEDKEKLDLFNQYRRKTNELMVQYENQYGPINLSADVLDNSPFLWEQLPFPWEGGNK